MLVFRPSVEIVSDWYDCGCALRVLSGYTACVLFVLAVRALRLWCGVFPGFAHFVWGLV